MMNEYIIRPESKAAFTNNAFFCVGTGRMGLALQKEYMDQLKYLQDTIGFSHMRGHGLFCDDMAIYEVIECPDGQKSVSFNFTYLDRVYDSYLSLGIKPFIELGFMPGKMASGDQTIFYWKGNTTPPADYDQWADLIHHYLLHLIDRYGKAEVQTWPCEVWNEPNLKGFWKDADMQEYFRLYKVSVTAVKDILPEMPVGGPAVCGGENNPVWMRSFLEYCDTNDLPLDFFSRHIYMAQTPARIGKYVYHAMTAPENSIAEAEETRKLIDSFDRYKGLPLHITEFNTSYNPRCPTHDTIYNGALICALLSRLGDTCSSYSYWTFGDVFEETGVYDRLFHGGFGLIAEGNIPKPTYWTYRFFKELYSDCVLHEDNAVVTRNGNIYKGVLWNLCQPEKDTMSEEKVSITVPAEKDKEYVCIIRRIDAAHGNPLKVWHDIGEPATLNREQKELLIAASAPEIITKTVVSDGENVSFNIDLSANAFAHITVKPVSRSTSLGYTYPKAENE